MTKRFAELSPLVKARIAGIFYLLCILLGMLGATLPSGGPGLAANLGGTGCYVVVTLILYGLLKPVNASISLLAALFSLMGCAIGALEFLHLPAPHVNSLVFFGFYCLMLAFLIFRSTFLPRFLGVLLAIAGLGWLTFLSPPLAQRLFFPYLMIAGLAGEGSLTLWLLAYGVNVQKWQQAAKA